MLSWSTARKSIKITLGHSVWCPWVLRIKEEFENDIVFIVGADISSAFINAQDFQWTVEITLYIDNLSIEHEEGISVAFIIEDNCVDSLAFDIVHRLGIV